MLFHEYLEHVLDNVGGKLITIGLESLRPDWDNPRFPPGVIDKFADDLDVYAYLDKQFDAASIAESIARHGFFQSEPLIAIPADEAGNSYIVLEGNRRLAALQGLTRGDVRLRMTDPRWKSLPSEVPIIDGVPVLVASFREEVAPILGYRHVTGITPWDPYQQARYVSSLIDDDDSHLSASDVAKLIGRDVSEVRAFYRNFSIVEQARDVFSLSDPDRMVDEFGVWTRAMTSLSLREYIGAPAPRDVVERHYALPSDSGDALGRLVTWIFGKPRSNSERDAGRQSKEGRVISDSRQITRLGKVISNPQGVYALESGATLAEAEQAALDKTVRFAEALDKAEKNLQVAQGIATSELLDQHKSKIATLASVIEHLRGGA